MPATAVSNHTSEESWRSLLFRPLVQAILGQPPEQRWNQEQAAKAEMTVRTAVDALAEMLKNGKPLSETFRIEVGEPMSPALKAEMIATVRAVHPELFEAQPENKQNSPRQPELPFELASVFRACITIPILNALKDSFMEYRGHQAALTIGRDYDWNHPIPGVEDFLTEAAKLKGFAAYDFNQRMPDKFCILLAFNGRDWSCSVRRPLENRFD
jgi:plasmid stabilization system protein ParE